ncbi:bifunctional chorismate mutase/prephenate dehydrogenase [Edwardsiella piscicida]|nr:bifunctional chorismate mutase/prephenate dehydrogenase [Edwardsiella piscicida]WLJ46063.1 bifunctional chorismate mutase/prephenate dehydrogenase [Edwardsiella piscicida]
MVAELSALRDSIDEVDKALLGLLARRLQLVAQVGEVKSRYGLPVYVPEREAVMLASRRAEAQQLGVSPDLIEDVLRRVMRESYVSENDKGFKALNPTLRPVVIVGGAGQMGRLFARMLRLSGYSVRILEPQDWPQAETLCADAGMVMISVPIHLTEAAIARLPPLPSDCLLVDLGRLREDRCRRCWRRIAGPSSGYIPCLARTSAALPSR